MWHSGINDDARNTPPFSSLRVPSYRFPSESVLGSIQSGVSGVSGFCVPRFDSRFPLKLPSGYPVPKYHAAGSAAQLAKCPICQGFPHFPQNSKARLTPIPIHGVFPLFAVRPLRGGGIMANFRSHVFSCGRDFFNGSRRIPSHSDLNVIQGYSTRRRHTAPCLDVVGKGAALRRVGTRRAERSSTRSLDPQKGAEPRREASRIKPTLSVRSHAAPTGISSGRIGTRTAARVRPRCGRT